jgi:hypothetical protein
MRAYLLFGALLIVQASAGVISLGKRDSTAYYPVIEEDIVESKHKRDSTAYYPVIEEDIVEAEKRDSTAYYPVIEEDIVEPN